MTDVVGERRPTLRDVAARAGVSKSLVSLVLRGGDHVSVAKRQAVEAAIEELDYRPNALARGLKERRTHSVGVIVADLSNPHFTDVLAGFEQVCTDAGLRMVLGNAHRDAGKVRDLLRTFGELRTDAIGILGTIPGLSDVDGSDPLADLRCPLVVGAAGGCGTPGADVVANDDHHGAVLATEHLVALGHRRICHLSGGAGTAGNRRRVGFLDTVGRHAIADRCRVEPGDFTEEAGYTAASRLLADPDRPTAIFAGADISAIGVLSAASELGLSVPGDLSVVGYDNTAVARIRPISLTTVDPGSREIGLLAATYLTERIAGQVTSAGRSHLIAPNLVVRSTTGVPPTAHRSVAKYR